MPNTSKILFVICGPTAVGKTEVAIKLARHYKTEIISADSRQCYKEMHIGTAAPNAEELQGVPYHLLGNVSIHQDYNAGMFEHDALKVCETIFNKQDIAFLAGGTGLYINTLCFGLDKLPVKDDNLRKTLQLEYEQKGIAYMQEKIKKLDEYFYLHGEIHNPQRLLRALEICILTGKPYTSLKKNQPAKRNFNTVFIGLNLPREILYDKINRRVEAMIEKGLLNEAKQLFPYKHLNALQTVGYKECFDYFDGKITCEQAIDKIKQHTRNYAKRQITWFKNQYHKISWFKPDEIDLIIKYINTYL